tara:strand:- start:293 stop:535 length:243 start_codon:yes stop_codon:yes gene_type:complete
MAALFGALPIELEEKILYEKCMEIFCDKDMNFRDVSEAIEACLCDGDRIDVLVRWIDSQSYDEEWREGVPMYVLTRCAVN